MIARLFVILLSLLLLAACSAAVDTHRFAAICGSETVHFSASFILRDGECVRIYNNVGTQINSVCGCTRVVEEP